MSAIPKWAEKIIAVHLAVTDQVSHSERMKSERYFVWQEEPHIDLIADGRHAERITPGTTDLFTRLEFDPWADAFEAALNAAEGIAWAKESIQYEDETGLYHYEWSWEVIG